MMRAKMVVYEIDKNDDSLSLVLKMRAVSKTGPYPLDGADEDNSYSRFTPTAEVQMVITNPKLFGSFAVGQKFYVDFSLAGP